MANQTYIPQQPTSWLCYSDFYHTKHLRFITHLSRGKMLVFPSHSTPPTPGQHSARFFQRPTNVLTHNNYRQSWVFIPINLHHHHHPHGPGTSSSVMGRRLKRQDSEMSLLSVSLLSSSLCLIPSPLHTTRDTA